MLLEELASGLYEGALRVDQLLGVVPAEGILLAMHSLLSPGDHVITMTPGYTSLRTVAETAIGCEVSEWAAQWSAETGEPGFTVGALRQLIRPGSTKMVVVNFPHNPTGALLSPAEWDELVCCCDKHGVWLFSDEMYRHLERDGVPTLPSAAESYSKGVSLSGLSKAYGLPGLRVGWLAAQDTEVLRRAAELKDYTTICAGAPNECLGLIALRARKTLWARCNGIIDENIGASPGGLKIKRPA